MSKKSVHYGVVHTAGEIGTLARAHRKAQGVTIETVSGLGNVNPRFLSEFERGKETAELGKVLKALQTLGLEVIVRPRGSGQADPGTVGDPADD